MSEWHGGKGSVQRPTNKRRFDENFEKIFNKKAPEERVRLDEGVHTPESDGRGTEGKLREVLEGAGLHQQAGEEQAVEQEPVAWLITHHENPPVLTFNRSDYQSERFVKTPLYARPLKRQPLNDDEINEFVTDDITVFTCKVIVRSVEKAHGIE